MNKRSLRLNKKLLVVSILVSFVLLFSFAMPTFAKKRLPGLGKVSSKVTSTKGITTTVKFTNYKRAIKVTFSNLSIAKSVNYSLTYTANGVEQGFGGNLTDLTGTQTREITLGTCSNGICRYDTNIKNAKFVVTTTLQNGKKVIKTFKLKI